MSFFFTAILSSVLALAAPAQPTRVVMPEKFPGRVKVQVDLFTQPAVDILVVVDNSGSMSSHQQNLAAHANYLVNALTNVKADFHIGVITTDMSSVSDKGRLQGRPSFLDSSTPSLAQVLAERLKVGTNGDAKESPLAAVIQALNGSLSENQGFLRPQASLYILLVTDAEDQSGLNITDFESQLTQIKGDTQRVLVDGIIVPSGQSNCERDEVRTEPKLLEEAIQFFKGTVYGLCDTSYSSNVQNLADRLIEFSKGSQRHPQITVVPLPSIPLLSSVEVRFGAQVIPGGIVDKGWSYKISTNEVILGPDIDWQLGESGVGILEISYVPEDWAK